MLTVTLTPEYESRLKSEAARHGLDPNDYAVKLIEDGLAKLDDATVAMAEVLTQWEAETATDDPAEIAGREKEFEEFKEGMNRNRLEMEGPLSRKIYP